MTELAQCRILLVEDEYMLAFDLLSELEDRGAIVLGPEASVDAALKYIVSMGVVVPVGPSRPVPSSLTA